MVVQVGVSGLRQLRAAGRQRANRGFCDSEAGNHLYVIEEYKILKKYLIEWLCRAPTRWGHRLPGGGCTVHLPRLRPLVLIWRPCKARP